MTGDAARRVGGQRIDGVGAAAGAGRERVVLDVVPDVSTAGGVGVLLLVFQRPLMLAGINLAEVVDAGVLLRGIARPNEVRNRNGGQQADDGNHDHDFNERKARFA